jgi:hypothetical protein
MTFWTRWTQRGDEPRADFEDAVRVELGRMPVPHADERLLARILDSRRRGSPRGLPLENHPRRRRLAYAFGAIAAAIAALVAVQLIVRDPGAVSEGAFAGWFATGPAFAQASPAAPAYPGARVTQPANLKPMQLAYACTERASHAVTTLDMVLSIARDAVDGAPAWRAVSIRRGPGSAMQWDSVWVSTATLAPLRRTIVEAPYRKYERIVVQQTFSGPRVRGDMHAFQAGGVSANRSFDRSLPADSGPYVAGAFAPVCLAGVAMGSGWRGSVAVLGWAVRDDDVFTPLAMRVDGEEMVRVPAGAYPCWRIAVDLPQGRHQWHWVRKSDGLGIRMVDSTNAGARGVREIVLRSEHTP